MKFTILLSLIIFQIALFIGQPHVLKAFSEVIPAVPATPALPGSKGVKAIPAIPAQRAVVHPTNNPTPTLLPTPTITPVPTETPTVKPLIAETGSQTNPDIYGKRIVYENNNGGNAWTSATDLIVYDLLTHEKKIINSRITVEQHLPKIYGDKIVWRDDRNGSFDVFVYDVNTETQTQLSPTDGHHQFEPRIYENKIVWTDWRYGNWEIVLYDLTTNTETRLTNTEGNESNPDIYENRVVYRAVRNGQLDIYLYDLNTNTETQLTDDSAHQNRPKVFGDYVVWEDSRNGNSDIYMTNLATGVETRVTPEDEHTYMAPDIWGNKVTFENVDGSSFPVQPSYDIHHYDISTGHLHKVTNDPYSQSKPAIYQNTIVWEEYENDNYGDISSYR